MLLPTTRLMPLACWLSCLSVAGACAGSAGPSPAAGEADAGAGEDASTGACIAGRTRCDGADVLQCRADGSGYAIMTRCDGEVGDVCDPRIGACRNLCEEASRAKGYEGCEYFPTVTSSSFVPPEFEFAVVISNPTDFDAHVVVEREGRRVRTADVAPHAVEVMRLPWVHELRGTLGTSVVEHSSLVRGGAYHLRSSVPVVAYQFSPLEFRIAQDCFDENYGFGGGPDGQCFSLTNDASLLLPTHALGREYIALSRPTHLLQRAGGRSSNPGFVSIVGVSDETVSVEVVSRAHVQASRDGSIEALAPGDRAIFQLGRGDVIQLTSSTPTTCDRPRTERDYTYCEVGPDYDLTGTLIHASGPVQVIGGHNCAFVPYDRWACDHLEESLLPVETWGKELLVTNTRPLRGEPNLVRVISGGADNRVVFQPAVREPVLLGVGESVELELSQAVHVEGTQAIAVAQFLVGQDWAGFGSGGVMGQGDPSMTIAVPIEQYRSRYNVLVPDTYTSSYFDVVAPLDANVMLDGVAITSFEPLGTGDWKVAHLPVGSGAHALEGDVRFSLSIYGFGSYTSYMMPGGLDLLPINLF